ncbi:G-type lectin S-receptor-like serine/threonine-protein kinase At1g11300 isoform X2 [Typha latifolia]|uniref:G-type lectin S-receptor-like serine/threonine-protein kinase At1g11300 isoform X2 n=1 Tax=Typha latifolia TaxID=4733 RepID=UPI003C2CF56D
MERSLLYITILLLSSLLSSHIRFCSSADRLTPGQSISIDETIVSDGGAFALGFFSPTNSTTNLYLGIWYNNIPQRSVIWIANREDPITDSSATASISKDVNIVVTDVKARIIWTSNVTSNGSLGNSTEAVLLNSGNFVLRATNDAVIWQSFDYPTDTIIPGMKLQLSHKTHAARRLIAWKDSEDPSLGEFSVGADPNTSIQIFTWRGSTPFWRSSVWAGNLIAGARSANSNFVMYVAIIDNEDEIYITFSLSDGSASTRYTLDYSGKTNLLTWDGTNWSVLASWPNSSCDTYGHCGPFGYCDSIESIPTCKCLQGFEPVMYKDWSNGNFSGGCRRTEDLECGGGDGFLSIGGMKVPDNFLFLSNRTIDECEAECLDNCSCTAYAYANLSTISSNISRCLVWMGELIDAEMKESGENLYLRLAGYGSGGRRKEGVIISITVFGTIILISCIYFVWKYRDKILCVRKKDKLEKRLVNYQRSNAEFAENISGSNEFGEGNPGQGLQLPLINFESIVVATDNFSDSHKLGQGGFGKVYKGKLHGEQQVAVKRLIRGSGQGIEEFKNEVVLIAKLQHRNLVRLLGCCIQGEEKLLVYEYMPNKSLDYFLFDSTRKSTLDWKTRFKIIKGIGRGLLYLHQDSRLTIIHRDLKASNVLLDEDMNPKISDFGMARIFGDNQDQANTNRVVGTYGYMSPEYAMEGLFSVKSDIYSFGVLLLEIAWKLWNEEKANEFTDESIAENCSVHEALRCIHVGLLCVQDHPNDRPTMSSVIFMLENEIAIHQQPSQPFFTCQRNVDEHNQRIHNVESLSTNNVTLTMVEGR